MDSNYYLESTLDCRAQISAARAKWTKWKKIWK